MTSKRFWGAASICLALSFAPNVANAGMPVQLQAAEPQGGTIVKAHYCACRHHHHHHRHYRGAYYHDPYYYWGPRWTRYWDMRFM